MNDLSNVANSYISYLVDEFVHNKVNRKIMKMHFIDGETYEAIAETVGRTPRQVAYVVEKCSADLGKHIEK